MRLFERLAAVWVIGGMLYIGYVFLTVGNVIIGPIALLNALTATIGTIGIGLWRNASGGSQCRK